MSKCVGELHIEVTTDIEEVRKEFDKLVSQRDRLVKETRRLLASHKDCMWCFKNKSTPDLGWSEEIEGSIESLLSEIEDEIC